MLAISVNPDPEASMSVQAERIRDAEARLLQRYHARLTERFVSLKVNGQLLRLRVLEAGSGKPLLLLHPAGWFAAHWAPLLPYLPGFRLLCLDFPGHGLSDGVDYREHAPRAHTVALLRELVAALSLGKVALVGNSLGGMAALWFASAEPDLVSSLVLLGLPGSVLAGARADLALAALSIPGVNRLVLRLPSSPKGSRALLGRALGPSALSRMATEQFDVHYVASRRDEFVVTLSTFMQATLRWRSPRPGVVLSDAELRAIAQPVHFVWGEGDIYGSPSIGRRTANILPHATLEVRPGGHFPQLDAPETCAQSILQFLGSS